MNSHPSKSNRPQRVADLIKRTLAQLLLREAKDPRFMMVSITAVDISPDLSNALVYVSVLDENRARETLDALNKAAGYFRHALADAVELRILPKLQFLYDESIVEADKINRLLDDALQKVSTSNLTEPQKLNKKNKIIRKPKSSK